MKGSLGLLWLASCLVLCAAAPAPESSRSTYRVEPVEASEAEKQLALLAKNEGGRVLPDPSPLPQSLVPHAAAPPAPPSAPVPEQQGPGANNANHMLMGAISGAQAQSGETSGIKRQPETKPAPTMPQVSNELEVGLDLTPRMVSQYLLITGDFAGFSSAMKDLLQAKLIMPEDAQRYKDAVGEEYENLLSRLAYARDLYLQEMIRGDVLPLEVRLRLAALADPGGDETSAVARMRLQALLQKEIKLDQLLKQLLAEYNHQDAVKPADDYNAFRNADDGADLDQLLSIMANAVNDDLQMSQESEAEALPLGSGAAYGADAAAEQLQQLPQEPQGTLVAEKTSAVPQPTGKDLHKEVPAPSSNEPVPTSDLMAQQESLLSGNRMGNGLGPESLLSGTGMNGPGVTRENTGSA